MAGTRGSEKLLEAWKVNPIDEKLVERIAAAIDDLEVVRILTKGIPAVDFLRAEFAVVSDDPERCGNTVSKILTALRDHAHVPSSVIVFPKGIPQIDRFELQVELGAG